MPMMPVLATLSAAGAGMLARRIGLRFAHAAGLPLLAVAMSSARRRAAVLRGGFALSLPLLLLAGFHGCRCCRLRCCCPASAAVVLAASWMPLRSLFASGDKAHLRRRGVGWASIVLLLGVNEKTGIGHRKRMFRSMLRMIAATSRGSRWQFLSHGRGGCIGWASRSRSALSSS